jgi:hypothetical protein
MEKSKALEILTEAINEYKRAREGLHTESRAKRRIHIKQQQQLVHSL